MEEKDLKITEEDLKMLEEMNRNAAPATDAPSMEEIVEASENAPAPKALTEDTTGQGEQPAKEKEPDIIPSMKDFEEELNASFKKLNDGDIISGTVIAVDEEEITLDLRYYTEGIIKVSDYSRDPDFMVKEEVHVGDEISATVIGRDNRRGCILLSRVEANDVLAWDKLRQLKEDKTVLTVTVKEVVNAGVVAYVEDIRGFIPASKLALNYVEDLEEYKGKQIQVQVFDVIEEDQRLILSARELLREKAAEERKAKISNVEIGLVTEGTVESLQPYGAFVNLGNGLSGLVHISQISEKRIKHPKAVLTVGEKVKVKVIDVKDGKLSLSMKALHDVAAQEIVEETWEMPETEEATSSLGALLAGLKLN